MNKKLFAWALFDFAGLLIVANFSLYLSQWVVVENHVPDILYAAVTAISTIFLLMVGPVLGRYADKTGQRMKLIIPLTVLTGMATIGIGVFGLSTLGFLPKLAFILFFFLMIQFAHQLVLIFYDTMIPDLSSSAHYGKISGIGDGIGTLGFLAGMVITYPFVNGAVRLFGQPGRLQAFIPSGIIFLILSAPMLFLFKDRPVGSLRLRSFKYKEGVKSLSGLLKDQGLFSFLLAFYFISDAVLTAQTFFAIFFQQALGFNDKEKIAATAIILGFSSVGAAIIGKVSDRFGPKRLQILTTFLLAMTFTILPLLPAGLSVWGLFVFLGLAWGGFYAVARSLLTHLAPKGRSNEVFSLYTIFRRFASVVGPLVWGITLLVLRDLPTALKYKLAIYPLVALMILGLVLLKNVPEIKVKKELPLF